MESRAFFVSLIVGILATVTMDVAAVIALRLGIAGRGPRRTGPDLIGRWIGYLARGKFKHDDILRTPPLRRELPLGLLSHYAIGIVLSFAYFTLLGAMHIAPSFLTAILYGLATTVFPWFLMFPSQGMGWLGASAPAPAHLTRTSLYNHAVFGLGLGLWTFVIGPR
jgi:Protein of unknown function (DUF2938)